MDMRQTLGAGIALAIAALAPTAANAQQSGNQWFYNAYGNQYDVNDPAFGCVSVGGFRAIVVVTGMQNEYGDRYVTVVPTDLITHSGRVDTGRYNELMRGMMSDRQRQTQFEAAARAGEVPFITTMSGSSTSIDMHSGLPTWFRGGASERDIYRSGNFTYNPRLRMSTSSAPVEVCVGGQARPSRPRYDGDDRGGRRDRGQDRRRDW